MKKKLRLIVIGSLLLILASTVALVLHIGHWAYSNHQAEKRINMKFWNEVQNTPNFSVRFFKLWEGDSMVTAEIENRGEVRFWYGEMGVPNIISVGTTSVDYSCNFDDDRTHFTTGLDLSSGSQFVPLFGFEINNLSDLVKNYDALNMRVEGYAASSSKTTVKMNIREKYATCEFP